jgi:hypothetical protein
MMHVDGGAVWENDRGGGKSLVRDDATVVDFRSIKLIKLYIRKQLRTQIHNEELKITYILENNEELKCSTINCILQNN